MNKLTVAIPTYNRCNYLVECIESILEQITDEVDIVVSDNASTDETIEIMQKYRDYEFIHYCRNNRNLGMDGNFLNCINKSNGEFIHLMSDDDIMLPGTITAIINCINNTNPDFIHMNSCSFIGKYNGIENCSTPRFNMEENLVTKNKNLFLKMTGTYITYLSSLVLKKELVNQIFNPEQFLGTFFLQSHVALLTTEGDKTLVILNHNSVAARGGNTGGYNLYKIWVEEYKKLLLNTAVKVGYDKKCMNEIYVKSVKKDVKSFILSFRLNNTGFELNRKNILLKNTYMHPSIWLSVYPVAYLPVSLLKFLRCIKRQVMKLIFVILL